MIWPVHGNLMVFVINFLISQRLKNNLKISLFFSEKWLCYNGWVKDQISKRTDIYQLIVFYFWHHFEERKI